MTAIKTGGQPIVIIKFGLEGGGATVLGREVDGVWSYWHEDGAMQDIDADDEWKYWTSVPVGSLLDALPHNWVMMSPRDLQPTFCGWFREPDCVLHRAEVVAITARVTDIDQPTERG